MLGRPVVKQMVEAGFDVTALMRDMDKIINAFPSQLKLLQGDLKNTEQIDQLLHGQDAVYISLSVPQNEKINDWHSETDGMKIILESAKRQSIQRIILLSSLVQRYQGKNNFNWWVFELKDRSVEMVKESGISFTIFYPSTFMESFLGKYKQGKRILMAGKSEYPMYYIAGDDFGKQVVHSLRLSSSQNKEYVIQGPEPLRPEEAANIFVNNYKKEKLSISTAPFGLLKFLAIFSAKIEYGVHIIEALNKYPEKFESENTWRELGKPETTLKEFAEAR